jgi:hypothetical protein
MVLCPYGSVPKSGAPPYVWLTWLDAQSWLGSVFAKLSFLSYLVPPVLKEINSFCATDPPQPVAPSNADIVAAAFDPVKFEALIQYIKDSIYWWVWSNNCVCNPNPSAPPTCTAGWSSSFVPTAVGPLGSQAEAGVRFTSLQIGAEFSGWRIWTPQALNYAVGLTLWTPAGVVVTSTTITAGIPAGYHTYTVTPVTLTAGSDYIVSYCIQPGYLFAEDAAVPPNDLIANWIGHIYTLACGVLPVVPSGGWEGIQPILCVAAAPTTPAAPPVPTVTTPDFPGETGCTTQDVCNLAQQLLQSVTLLRAMVDLMQRRLLPFAWILGTPHTGLTGTGVISVQDVLGAAVSMTVPGGWGSTAETPRRLIPSAGSLQGSDGTSYSDNFQLHYESELIFFGQSWATGIRYNFRPGVTATLTPLLPEP